MRFCDLCEKEVINADDCRCIGRIRDVEFDPDCGRIKAVVIPGPGKYMGCFCRDFEYCIPWDCIVRIGPDIVLVHLHEDEMRKKIK